MTDIEKMEQQENMKNSAEMFVSKYEKCKKSKKQLFVQIVVCV